MVAKTALSDPTTSLAYLSNGRYYDPALGRPLQPNPSGGPAIVPQALNRYAVTSVGQVGVAEATTDGENFLLNLTILAGSNTPGALVGDLARITVQPVIRANKTNLLKAQRIPQVRSAIGEDAARSIRARYAGKTNAQLGLQRGEIIEFAYSSRRLIRPGESLDGVLTGEFNRASLGIKEEFVGLRGLIAQHPLAIGIGIDVGISALLELNAPYWSNPYLNPWQKGTQFTLNLGAVAATSIATYFTIAAIGVTGPAGVIVIIVAGTGYGLFFGQVSEFIIEGVGANQENRQLKPLGGGT